MKIDTARFGEMEIDESKTIIFEEGPLGFENKQKWIIIDNGLLNWMQSLDDPELAFVVANPFSFYQEYEFDIEKNDLDSIKAPSDKSVSVLGIVSVPPKVENMTINLVAPIVINSEKRLAKQIVLNSSKYTVRHFLYQDLMKLKGEEKKAKEAVNA
jgi:flagellar assembly factor FliW